MSPPIRAFIISMIAESQIKPQAESDAAMILVDGKHFHYMTGYWHGMVPLHMKYVVDNTERRVNDRQCNDQILELDLMFEVPDWVLQVARQQKWWKST